jgi:hypothetical protein
VGAGDGENATTGRRGAATVRGVADSALLEELNRDVWHAFRRAYGERDAPTFLGIHSRDLIRAGGPTKEIHDYDEYAARTGGWFAELTARGDGIGIEFRFLERIAGGGLASERGIFRITATRVGEEAKVFHGRFHTLCRKVDGRWLICADYDSDEGGTVTADMFDAGTDIDDVGTYS